MSDQDVLADRSHPLCTRPALAAGLRASADCVQRGIRQRVQTFDYSSLFFSYLYGTWKSTSQGKLISLGCNMMC